jgi:hypothetical protein
VLESPESTWKTEWQLSATLNRIYYPETTPSLTGMPMVYFLPKIDLHEATGTPLSEEDASVRSMHLTRNLDKAVVLYIKDANACLRMLSDAHRNEYPHNIPSSVRRLAPYSHADQIRLSNGGVTPPETIFGSEPEHTWCYYFQKAELARQQGDWERVAELGDETRKRGFEPKDLSEWVPFIEGYAQMARCNDALALAERAQAELRISLDEELAVCGEKVELRH